MAYVKKQYNPAKEVVRAEAELKAHAAAKPGEYVPTYGDKLNDTLNRITDRAKFTYDPRSDALYDRYRDEYIRQGRLAMRDTAGQASALTGGYGSSYSAAAGQQAYSEYLSRLNDVIPELEARAYDRYRDEGEELYDQYDLLASSERGEYDRYRDSLGDYYDGLDYLSERYDAARDYDRGAYEDDLSFDYNLYLDAQEAAYRQDRDITADSQWQQDYDLRRGEYEREKEEYEASRAAKEYDSSAEQIGISPLDNLRVIAALEEYRGAGNTSAIRTFISSLPDSEYKTRLWEDYITARETPAPVPGIGGGNRLGGDTPRTLTDLISPAGLGTFRADMNR